MQLWDHLYYRHIQLAEDNTPTLLSDAAPLAITFLRLWWKVCRLDPLVEHGLGGASPCPIHSASLFHPLHVLGQLRHVYIVEIWESFYLDSPQQWVYLHLSKFWGV